MQTKETKTNDGGFTRLLVVETVVFSIFLSFFFFFFQLQEGQDQLIDAVKCAEKTQDHIQKYDLKQCGK